MSIGWDGAAAPALPPLAAADRLRLWVRAPLLVGATAACLLAFVLLRGLDAGLAALWRAPPRLAPLALRAWGRSALALMGLSLERRGRDMPDAGAIVANHAGWLDIAVLLAAATGAFVSKSEVAGWPVIGQIGRIIGTVFIDRRARETRRQSEALAARLERGDRLCLFPEGTSTDGQRVLGFKSSLFGVFLDPALRSRVRVQPVSIRYLPPARLPPDFYGWWGEMEFAGHLANVLARSRGGVVRVVLHPPLAAADFTDRKAFAQAAQRAVAAGFEPDPADPDPEPA